MKVHRKLTATAICILVSPLVFCQAARGQGIDYNVGAYYYPWYGSDFHGGPNSTLRYHLAPRQAPTLGWYDQRQASVISQHYRWAVDAGIDFFVCSWWGQGRNTDTIMKDHMFGNPDRGDIKLAVFLEPSITMAKVYSEVSYLCATQFNNAGYYRIDGKPVVFVYLTRTKSNTELHNYVYAMRRSAQDAGVGDLYIVGDEIWGTGTGYDTSRIDGVLDGITNYDVYGHMNGIVNSPYVQPSAVQSWDTDNATWQGIADSLGIDFVPSVSPGFNDTAVRSGHDPISRKLGGEAGEFGSLFRELLQNCKDNTDADIGNMLMVTSWNEWHEDTQIEPVGAASPTHVDDSLTGSDYTRGIYYEGYGTRYLDILRAETVPDPGTLGLLCVGASLSLLKRGRKCRWS